MNPGHGVSSRACSMICCGAQLEQVGGAHRTEQGDCPHHIFTCGAGFDRLTVMSTVHNMIIERSLLNTFSTFISVIPTYEKVFEANKPCLVVDFNPSNDAQL